MKSYDLQVLSLVLASICLSGCQTLSRVESPRGGELSPFLTCEDRPAERNAEALQKELAQVDKRIGEQLKQIVFQEYYWISLKKQLQALPEVTDRFSLKLYLESRKQFSELLQQRLEQLKKKYRTGNHREQPDQPYKK